MKDKKNTAHSPLTNAPLSNNQKNEPEDTSCWADVNTQPSPVAVADFKHEVAVLKLTQLSPADYPSALEQEAKNLCCPVPWLDKMVKEHKPSRGVPKYKPQQRMPECLYPPSNTATVQPPPKPPGIASDPRILDRFREAIFSCGVVGEDAVAATLYLLITSRLLNNPVSAAVKGLSSSGKSFTTQKTVEFFPSNAVITMTAMSERALVYFEGEYSHRTIVLYEATALRENAEDDMTSYFVRSLLSEGRINYSVTVRDPKEGGFKTKEIIKEGPTNLIITTTKARVHAENETRLLSLNTNDTPLQTKAILKALASEQRDGVDKTEWHQLQEWLRVAEHRVTIPFAVQLAELVPPVAVRMRRDFGALLALVKSHAILHQLSRERDEEGRIIATIDDYAQVRELAAPIMSESVGSAVSDAVRETVESVEALAGESGVMALAIANRLNLDKGTVSRRLTVAASQGYVRNLEERRGKPGRWVKGDPLPEELHLLPQPSELDCQTKVGCTVAVKSGGHRDSDSAVQKSDTSSQSATGLLVALVAAIQTEARDGLYPSGCPDCPWGVDGYPHEYHCAQEFLETSNNDESWAFDKLAELTRKIACEAARGTPLRSNYREWQDGSYPQAFLDAESRILGEADGFPVIWPTEPTDGLSLGAREAKEWIQSPKGKAWLEETNRQFIKELVAKNKAQGWNRGRLIAEAQSFGLLSREVQAEALTATEADEVTERFNLSKPVDYIVV